MTNIGNISDLVKLEKIKKSIFKKRYDMQDNIIKTKNNFSTFLLKKMSKITNNIDSIYS